MSALRAVVDALERVAERVVRTASGQVRSAAPPVPHRGDAGGPTGGSLASRINKGLIRRGRTFVVIQWNKLGQPFMLFNRGSSRQKARPIDLSPTEAQVRAAAEAAIVKHYQERERRFAGAGR